MRVFLDADPIDITPTTLAEAMRVVRTRAEAAGRIVIEVKGDGQPVADHLIESPPDDDAGLAELRFTSTAPGPFAQTVLGDARGALTQIGTEQAEAARLLQEGQVEQARQHLGRAVEGWELVRQAAINTELLLGFGLASVPDAAAGLSGPEAVDRLATCLADLLGAVRDEDWSTAADLLGYDLGELVTAWRAALAALSEQVASTGG